MMTPIELRLATLTDLPGILLVELSTKEAPHWGAAQYRNMFLADNVLPKRHLGVAVSSEQIVGYVVVSSLLAEAEIESIAVMPAWRQQGIGRMLLELAILAASKDGAKAMRLEVRQSNVNAQQFYVRLGFQALDVRRAYYARPVEDAVLMCLTLPHDQQPES